MRYSLVALLLAGCMLQRAGTRVPDGGGVDAAFDAGVGSGDAGPEAGPLPDGAMRDSATPDAAGTDSGIDWPREMPTTCGGASTLRDLFDDGVVSSAWVDASDTGATISETRGRLLLAPPAGATGSVTRTSRYAVAMRDDRLLVEVIAAANGQTELVLERGSSNRIGIARRGGDLVLEVTRAGAADEQTVPYDAVTHRFWQIRESGGTVYWETSSDGFAWTEQRSETSPSFLDVVWVVLRASNLDGRSDPGSAALDHLNVDRIVAEHCGTSSMTDTFSASAFDAEWFGSPADSGACTTNQSSGSTRFSMSGAGVSHCERRTARAFDLREDYVYIHIPPINSFHPPMSAFLGVRDAAGTSATIAFVNDEYVFDVLGTTDANSYDDSHYWRIRGEGSEIVFDVSDNGSSWSEVHREGAGGLEVERVSPYFGIATTGTMPGSIGIGVPGYNVP